MVIALVNIKNPKEWDKLSNRKKRKALDGGLSSRHNTNSTPIIDLYLILILLLAVIAVIIEW